MIRSIAASVLLGAFAALFAKPDGVGDFEVITDCEALAVMGGACTQRGYPLNCGQRPRPGSACKLEMGFARMTQDRRDCVNFFKTWCSDPGPEPDFEDEDAWEEWYRRLEECGHTHTDCTASDASDG